LYVQMIILPRKNTKMKNRQSILRVISAILHGLHTLEAGYY
jgi:hypothetical protein